MIHPKASIIMAVFNGEKFLKESIESILNQSEKNFEFIIIDDGSKDESVRVIKSYKDSRIHLFKNKRNSGLPFSLNKAIEKSRANYLVRMDQDDISLPMRLETQIKFMDKNKQIDICGTAVYFDQTKKAQSTPINSVEEIKATLLFRNVLAHSTVIMRKSSLDKHNFRYDSKVRNAEDYDLWTRCCWRLNITNISHPLLFYRRHHEQMTKMDNLKPIVSASRNKFLKNFIENPTDEQIELHTKIAQGVPFETENELSRSEKWLLELIGANASKKLIDKKAFGKVIESQWFTLCVKSSKKLGADSYRKYLFSQIIRPSLQTLLHTIIFPVKLAKND